MADPGTVLLAATGAFVLLVVVVSTLDHDCLTGTVGSGPSDRENASEYAERPNSEE